MKSLFGGLKGAVIAILCVTLLALPTTGCAPQATIAALTQTLGNAAASVAALEGNSALATQLTNDTAAAVTAVNAWKNGTPAQDVIQALAIVQADLNLFPINSQYLPLIDLALGTVESILALLPGATTATAVRHVQFAKAPPKSSREFKSAWNGYIKTHPQLAQATIR